jgi:glucose-6-phosphate 1-dehydrogenase
VSTGIGKLEGGKNTTLLVEKPFGRDLESAQALDRILKKYFPEAAIFRIDHYLGKEPVQNLIYFHLANQFVNAGMNRSTIEEVQITMAETLGMEGRGHFYEEVGAIRDVLQNHMLQVVACLAMECPVGADDEDLRDEKARLMKAVVPLAPSDVVRGQYEGYRNEPGVTANSDVETFASVRLQIENERWARVPFYIRVGKRLPVSVTEIYIKYRPSVWTDIMHEVDPSQGDYLRLRLSPTVEIAHGTRIKRPGTRFTGECTELIAKQDEADEMSPYERLFRDAIAGNHELFARSDMTFAQWRVVENVLGDSTPLHIYAPGSWGPEASLRQIRGGAWRNPSMETKQNERLKRTA